MIPPQVSGLGKTGGSDEDDSVETQLEEPCLPGMLCIDPEVSREQNDLNRMISSKSPAHHTELPFLKPA